jgi:regulatory protein
MWRKRQQVKDESERVITDRTRARERTMNRAVKLLAAKPRSIGELRERLLEKTWTDRTIVDAVIEKLSEYKYLDDEQFAVDLAVSKLRQRPQGRRRLKQTLSQKKLDKEIVDQALATAFEKIPEIELIDQAIEKRVRLKGFPETRDDIKKFYDHLLRRGFSYDLVASRLRDTARTDLSHDENDTD